MLIEVIFFSFLAGFTVFIGGIISYYFEKSIRNKKLKERIIHFFIAFGTGIMISAIAFVLIPKGLENLSTSKSILIFLFGSIFFYYLDKFIKKNKTNIPQILAMLLDFIPESIALGALFVYEHSIGILLAFFIAMQNLPEAFNSYLELKKSNFTSKKALIILFILSFIGVVFSTLGYYFLNDKIEITSALMIFASGGIMYLIFQDISPALRLKNNSFIALGVNFGFVIGILGEALV